MKRMVYIIVALTGIVVAGVIFAGCAVTPDNGNKAQLTGLSFTQNHMNFGYCYSFYLREEDDGKVLFDAEVRFDEAPYCIILESCQVDRAELERLRSLDEEYSITDYVTAYRKKPLPFTISDKTVNKTTVYLSDGIEKSADSKKEHTEVLYEFFFEMAKKYINESVYVYEQ